MNICALGKRKKLLIAFLRGGGYRIIKRKTFIIVVKWRF